MPRNMNRYITINHTMHAHIVGHAPPTPNLRTATKLGNTKAAIETEIKLKMAANLAKGLPKQFDDFIYNEPIKTRKSTFCIWRTIADSEWQTGDTVDPDGSEDILYLLDGDPEKYVEFCEDYYEKEIPLDIVEKIYQGEPISLEMIYKLNDEIEDEDIEIIKNELEEIKYPNTL